MSLIKLILYKKKFSLAFYNSEVLLENLYQVDNTNLGPYLQACPVMVKQFYMENL